jgi:hypothetical protein
VSCRRLQLSEAARFRLAGRQCANGAERRERMKADFDEEKEERSQVA